MKPIVCVRRALAAGTLGLLFSLPAAAQTPVAPVENPCTRPSAGSIVQEPPALRSVRGVLSARFSYQHAFDASNLELLCFMTPDGSQNPTLHVRPGDHLIIAVTNNLPAGSAPMVLNAPTCGAPVMNSTSANIHYHGTNTSPTCHQDEVIKTIINAGQTFQYDVVFPIDEPPGLYFYHPHVHGIAEHAVQGGATAAIVVDGLESVQPAVGGLLQRILMVRDQPVPGNPEPGGSVPAWNLTLNYVPITSPTHAASNNYVPAVLQMRNGDRELWSICNSASDTILDLQYVFDGTPQTLQIVSIDGVPVNSQDGIQPGTTIPVTHFLLPTASRVEVIVSAPPSSVRQAQLITLAVDTGPDGDYDPQRPLATIQPVNVLSATASRLAAAATAPKVNARRFAGLATAQIAARRTVFFDEINATDTFLMVVEGKPAHVFDPNAAPDIVATQGQFLDMIHVPFWDGNPTHPFPSVTLLIDFRGSDVGDFPFHCHILEHEDGGMMNIVRVQNATSTKAQPRDADRAKAAKGKQAAASHSH